MPSPDRDELRRQVLAYLQTIVLPSVDLAEVGDDTNLFDVGVLDSLAVISIVEYLEQHHGARFGDGDLDPAELGSLAGILRVIADAAP